MFKDNQQLLLLKQQLHKTSTPKATKPAHRVHGNPKQQQHNTTKVKAKVAKSSRNQEQKAAKSASNSNKAKGNKQQQSRAKLQSPAHYAVMSTGADTQLNYRNYQDQIDNREYQKLPVCNCHNQADIRNQTAPMCTGKLCTCSHDGHRINHELLVGILKIHPKGYGFVVAGGVSYYVPHDECDKCFNSAEVSFIKYENKRGPCARIKAVLPRSLAKLIVRISKLQPLTITIDGDSTKREYPAVINTDHVQSLQVNDFYTAVPDNICEDISCQCGCVSFRLQDYISHGQDKYLNWYKSLMLHDLPIKTASYHDNEARFDQGSRVDLTAIPFISIDAADTQDVDDLIFGYELSDQDQVMQDNLSLTHEQARNLYVHSPTRNTTDTLSDTNEQVNNTQITTENNQDITDQKFCSYQFDTASGLQEAELLVPQQAKFILAIAIADPGHFFAPGSSYDQQAQLFGQTFYLPAFVLNMLPEELTNDKCSLLEQVNRPAVVSFLYFDEHANFLALEPKLAWVKNHAKLDYDSVATYLGDKFAIPSSSAITTTSNTTLDIITQHESLQRQLDLLYRFQQQRYQWRIRNHHVINNSSFNVDYFVNEHGSCIDIKLKEFLISHEIVTECMICANIYLAYYFRAKQIPGIYLTQEGIRDATRSYFKSYLQFLASDKNISGLQSYIDILESDQELSMTEFKEVRSIIELASPLYNSRLNRFMQAACYTDQPIPHVGLGEECYLTGTSPIRKYSDLYNQYNLKAYLWQQPTLVCTTSLIENLNTKRNILRSISKELATVMNYQYLKPRINQQFEVEITGVINAGIRIRLVKTGILGFIYLDKKIEHQVDVNNIAIRIGEQTYEFGDKIQAVLTKVEPTRFIFEIMTTASKDSNTEVVNSSS